MARVKKHDKKEGDDILDKLVGINRVSKVVKGGRRFGFAALVVAGDAKGQVGFAKGKAKEVPEAIKKDSRAELIVRKLRRNLLLNLSTNLIPSAVNSGNKTITKSKISTF